MNDDEFEPFFRKDFPKLVLHLSIRGFGAWAEEAAEDAMMEAYKKWPSITAPTAYVREAGLCRAKRIKQREFQRPQIECAARIAPGEILTPEISAVLTEEQNEVLRRIRAMPQKRRAVTALAFDGYNTREIASKLGIAENTVRSHLRHIRDTLGESTRGQGDEK